MEKFNKQMLNIKQKIILQENTLLHQFYNYIIQEIVNEYKYGYLFYFLLEDDNKENENILSLTLLLNIYYILIDIVFNLPYHLNIDITYNKLSIHNVYDETINLLGLMFFINHLTSLLFKNLMASNLPNKNEIYKNILSNKEEICNIMNTSIEDKEIDNILNADVNRTDIILKIQNIVKTNYINNILDYVSIINGNNRKKINIKNIYDELNKNNPDFEKIKKDFKSFI